MGAHEPPPPTQGVGQIAYVDWQKLAIFGALQTRMKIIAISFDVLDSI